MLQVTTETSELFDRLDSFERVRVAQVLNAELAGIRAKTRGLRQKGRSSRRCWMRLTPMAGETG